MEVKFYSTDGRELLLGFGNSGLLATVKETGTPYHGGLTAKAEGSNSGNGSECDCNCMMQPYHVVRHGEMLFNFFQGGYSNNEIAEAIHLNDMFPPDQCPGQKARVFYEDAILFCNYNINDLWVIDAICRDIFVQLN